jgi:hypothetical protein
MMVIYKSDKAIIFWYPVIADTDENPRPYNASKPPFGLTKLPAFARMP